MQEDSTRDSKGSTGEDGAAPLKSGDRSLSPAPGIGDEVRVEGRGDDRPASPVVEPAGGIEQSGDEKSEYERLMKDMRDYKIALDVFEGPLDLLLYLIKRDEVDIYDIPIIKITEQYLRYLGLMRMLDLDIASEFLVMSATLLHIKSRMLLPPEERPEEEYEDEDDDDPRMALVHQLLEYKKFKEAASYFSERESEQHGLFPRYVDRTFLPEPSDSPLTDVSIFDLISAFSDVLKRVDVEPKEIFEDRHTVSDKITAIMELMAIRPAVKFSELFKNVLVRTEVVVTFLALLELIRLKKVQAHQPNHFGEIEICAA